ncbi:hypothetical protein [Sphingobacterium detergens]|uniref:Uncharacterized protein n=1 Tax=Sphingobacterium detergens TaxID=1145106 RepID=A0A420ARU8_SPHD1|nr:hypothetical protein [Sphingobacterium detergens]RKE47186.1 hypothetical protein DFQ12_4350 [Sphingobacterium detergens]
MEKGLIRFEQEQNQWKEWTLRVKSEFGDETLKSAQFQKEYLRHLEGLEIKYRANANKFEQLELNILRAKRREIEKQLYPRMIFRLAYRLLRSREMRREGKIHNLHLDINYDGLIAALAKKGFTGLEKQLSMHVKSNQPEFRIPVSFQINESSEMKYELRFCKGKNDAYEIQDIKATLKGDQKGAKLSMLYSSIPNVDLTMKQVYNLLAGRAIEKSEGWVMLDINDRDAEGNLKTKVFNKEYGFSVEKLLEQSGIKGIDDLSKRKEILQSLREGDIIKVRVGKEIKAIEANPLHKSLEKPEVVLAKRQADLEAARREVKPQAKVLEEKEVLKVKIA